jgi:hypothetical protein
LPKHGGSRGLVPVRVRVPEGRLVGGALPAGIGSPEEIGVMRLILRIVGTWLLGLALILLIIDGTKSLSANALVWTALGDTWNGLSAESLIGVRTFFASRLFGALLLPGFDALLRLPGFAVLAVPGAVLAAFGRSRRDRLLIRQDQI